jgi:hypothetical protein
MIGTVNLDRIYGGGCIDVLLLYIESKTEDSAGGTQQFLSLCYRHTNSICIAHALHLPASV